MGRNRHLSSQTDFFPSLFVQKERLTRGGVERFIFVQADQPSPPECFVAKILQQVRRSLQFAHLG